MNFHCHIAQMVSPLDYMHAHINFSPYVELNYGKCGYHATYDIILHGCVAIMCGNLL